MPKLIDVVKSIGGDAAGYFTKNVGMNSTTGVTLVGAPALVTVIDQLSSGTDMAAALSAGGISAYVAIGWYALRFLQYLINKSAK